MISGAVHRHGPHIFAEVKFISPCIFPNPKSHRRAPPLSSMKTFDYITCLEYCPFIAEHGVSLLTAFSSPCVTGGLRLCI